MTPDDGRAHPPASSTLIGVIAVALAVAFQIQTTLMLAGSMVRLSLADLVSPIVFALLATALVRKKMQWPHWSIPYLWAWLGLLSAVLAMALIVGRVKFGFWLPWAAIRVLPSPL